MPDIRAIGCRNFLFRVVIIPILRLLLDFLLVARAFEFDTR